MKFADLQPRQAYRARGLPGLAAADLETVLLTLLNDPQLIFVTRRDKVAQAVSLCRALQTQAWRVEDGSSNRTAVYDFSGIDHLVSTLESDEREWTARFARSGLRPLTLTYEQLDAAPRDTVTRVLERLELPAATVPFPGLSRVTGAFILIDEHSNDTVGAGIISKARVVEPVREGRRDVTWHASALDRNERWSAIQQHGDRAEHIRRVGQVARLFADSGVVAVLSLISPLAADREDLRKANAEAELPFIEVFVDTPLGECERRDPKGLYARARAGEIKGFTGIDAPYEPPERPEIQVRTSETTVEEAVSETIGRLRPDPRP